MKGDGVTISTRVDEAAEDFPLLIATYLDIDLDRFAPLIGEALSRRR